MIENQTEIEVQNPHTGSPTNALAAFALLEKLDSGRRRPPPSISKVFRLYCIHLLSAAQVARQCRCSKAAVIRRLNFIRHKTGLPITRLRVHYPQPGFIDGLPAGSSSASRNGRNFLYADTDSLTE
jgi:hypothetical protein